MAYKEFKEEYGKAIATSEQARNLVSEELAKRMNARDYAMKEAKDTLAALDPALAASLANPVAVSQMRNSHDTLDQFLNQSAAFHAKKANHVYTTDLESILTEVPDKGLAKICIEATMPYQLPGNDDSAKKHNKRAEYHAKYVGIASVLQQTEGAEDEHEKLMGIAAQSIMAAFEETISSNEKYAFIKGDAEYMKLAASATMSALSISKSATRNYVKGKADDYRKKFDKSFADDKEKADYARETLRKMKSEGKDELVMNALYKA